MEGIFKVLDGNIIKTYYHYNDIPESFDNLIKCEFNYPEGPHTKEEHNNMEKYTELLANLLKRERK